MNTIFEKGKCHVSQQQLAQMREKYLTLMMLDMKILKGYLNELKELGIELKKRKLVSTTALTNNSVINNQNY